MAHAFASTPNTIGEARRVRISDDPGPSISSISNSDVRARVIGSAGEKAPAYAARIPYNSHDKRKKNKKVNIITKAGTSARTDFATDALSGKPLFFFFSSF